MREIPAAIARKLTEAADAFASSFEDLRMDDIARASGIPRATLYYHFSGKDDILAFLLASSLEEFRDVLAEVADAGGTARARLAGLVGALLRQLATRPSAAQLLVANLGRAGKLPDISAGVHEAFTRPFERVLEDGIQSGELRRVDVRAAATAIFGGVCIVGLQELVTRGGVDADHLSSVLSDVYWSGLSSAAPSPRRRT